jgi:hypothetical protein
VDVTSELRWFWPGTVPSAAAAWFGGAPLPLRTDLYATVAAASGVGLKVRAGDALELKASGMEIGGWSMGERAAGRVETWSKWAFPLAPGWTETGLGDGWLRVEKRRRIRRFALEPGPSGGSVAREIAVDEATGLGCDAELSDLSVRGMPWWTLAFEAFGHVPQQDAALRAAADLVLASAPAELVLSEAGSMAYPAWIAELDREPAVG